MQNTSGLYPVDNELSYDAQHHTWMLNGHVLSTEEAEVIYRQKAEERHAQQSKADTIYTNLDEAQAALDAGLTIRFALQPYPFDPALLQHALDLQVQERLEAVKQNNSTNVEQ